MKHSFQHFFPGFPMFPVAQTVPKGATLPDGKVAENPTVLINSGASFRMHAAVHAPAEEIDNILGARFSMLSPEGREAWDPLNELCRARVDWADALIAEIDRRTQEEQQVALAASANEEVPQ